MHYSCATESRLVLGGKRRPTPDGTYRESTLGPRSDTAGHNKEGHSKMSDTDGLDLGSATTAEGESNGDSSTGKGGGGSNRRQPVSVKGTYGTKFFDSDTQCDGHQRNAEGVLVIPGESSISENSLKEVRVLCRACREAFEDRHDTSVEEFEYTEFNP